MTNMPSVEIGPGLPQLIPSGPNETIMAYTDANQIIDARYNSDVAKQRAQRSNSLVSAQETDSDDLALAGTGAVFTSEVNIPEASEEFDPDDPKYAGMGDIVKTAGGEIVSASADTEATELGEESESDVEDQLGSLLMEQTTQQLDVANEDLFPDRYDYDEDGKALPKNPDNRRHLVMAGALAAIDDHEE